MINHSTFFIGLDLGDKHSHLCVLDQDGQMIEETRLPTTQAAFQHRFSKMPTGRVAMEVGTHSRWVSHLLGEMGHEALVANARKLRAINHNPSKGDQADAETFARLAILDPQLLAPIHHRSPEAQAGLAAIRSRDALVRSRTMLINHVRGMVKSAGQRLHYGKLRQQSCTCYPGFAPSSSPTHPRHHRFPHTGDPYLRLPD